jgi:PTH1 family peptidyl-tRNA hydrolase
MKLFVGLGNPGNEHAGNRHNVGFMAVERIAAEHGFGPWKRKFSGLAADGEIDGHKVLLLKPQTYMNESGRSVGEAARFLKIDEGDIVVFYDEIDLPPTKLRVKTGGGNAGHNGLRSISAHLGNEYVRVRIGIGHPGAKELVARWVLSDFTKADASWLQPLLGAIAHASRRLVVGDQSRFMTDVKKELEAERAASPEPERATPRSTADPAGEREGKRQSALAENIRKWLGARKQRD